MRDAVILANGAFPTHPYPLGLLHAASMIVCCDGAAEPLLELGREPDWIVGDLDSLPPGLAVRFAARIVHDPNQETNDLTKAVQVCLDKQIRRVTILGATGKREDHTLGNLGLLADYAERLAVELVTDHGTFCVVQEGATLEATPGQQVSIISLTPEVPVTARGLTYPLEQVCLTKLWQGTLNEAVDGPFSLHCPGGRLLVFLCFRA